MPKGISMYRAAFGVMPTLRYLEGEDGNGSGGTPPETGSTQGDTGDPKKGDGDAGKDDPADYRAKFEGQRQVNRDLEGKLNQLRDGLKSALGVEDKKADASDLIQGLADELATLKHTALVERVARAHQITDDDDIAILRSATDEDAMTRFAARLAPKDGGDGKNASGKPGSRPDPSQGKGGNGKGTTGVAAGRDLYDERYSPKQ